MLSIRGEGANKLKYTQQSSLTVLVTIEYVIVLRVRAMID